MDNQSLDLTTTNQSNSPISRLQLCVVTDAFTRQVSGIYVEPSSENTPDDGTNDKPRSDNDNDTHPIQMPRQPE